MHHTHHNSWQRGRFCVPTKFGTRGDKSGRHAGIKSSTNHNLVRRRPPTLKVCAHTWSYYGFIPHLETLEHNPHNLSYLNYAPALYETVIPQIGHRSRSRI